MFLTRLAIKRPVTTIMFYIALSILGVISWRQLPVQLLPNLTFPELSVQAAMPGASPEKLEEDLLIPAEQEIAKMKNVEKIYSTARNDRGSIRIEFKIDTDMKYTALKLEQKMNALSATLPAGSRVFVGRDFSTEMFSNFLMQLSIRGGGEIDRLRKIAEDKIKLELEKVDGIASVNVSGGQLREVHIDVDQEKAFNYGLDLVMIMSTIENGNVEKQYLGRVLDGNTISFVTFSGEMTRLSDLENLVVKEEISLKLKDIADIRFAKEEENQIFRINGQSSVGVFLIKDNTSNLIRTADRVQDEIDRLNRMLEPEDIEIVVNFSSAKLMQDTINQVEKLAVVGALLALLVLLFFLRNIKTVTVILISIPLSVLITFNIMYYTGLTINILSLIGLAIAIGMLVDNSIVVLENIFRHYDLGLSPSEASIKGTSEVTKAIIASTGTTIAVFTPTIFMQNKYFVILKELSLAVIFPLLISLLVAFTVIPMVASQFLSARGAKKADLGLRDSIVRKWQKSRLMEVFTVLLKSRLRSPRQTFIFLMILFIITLVSTIPFMTTFEDVESEEELPIYVDMRRGLGLKATDRATQNIEALADSIDIIKEIRTLVNEENSTVTLSFLEKNERSGKKHEKMSLEQIREYFERQARVIPDAEISFEDDRRRGGGSGGGGGGGGGNPLDALLGSQEEKIIVKGHDQEKMKHLVEDIEERLESFPEIRRVRTGLQRGALELQVWGDQEALDQNGLTMSRVMAALWAIRSGGQEMTKQLKDEDGEYLIRLKLDKEAETQTIDEVKSMIIPLPGGTLVPVKNVSKFIIDEGPRSINRIDHERQIEITYEFRDLYTQDKQYLNILRARVDDTIKNTQIPRGFSVEILHEEDTQSPIYNALILAFVLIFMILAATFESIKYPWIIFSAIPLALVGTLWGLIFTGTSLSIFAMISWLVLLGIVVNNGIILIDYILILREKHNFTSSRAVLHASRARVRPILMTSITTILGVLPFALKTGAANEIWPPFAIGLIGGLSFASLLTLVYVPVLFVSIDNFIGGILKGGRTGVILHVILNVTFVVFIYFWNESKLWMSVNIVFGLVIINAVVFNFFNYLDLKKRKISFGNDLKISIHNLTKIYNEPGKFKKDWRKRTRQEENLDKRGLLSIDYDAIAENLLWKLPLFGFFIYLHTFIENKFWILMLTIFTYFLAMNTLSTVRRLYRRNRGKEDITGMKPKHPRLYFVARIFAVIAMMVYLKTAWDSTFTWPVIFMFTWLFLWYARVVTRKIYRKEIIVHEITGKFSKTRRRFYRLLLKIPVIGKKKIEVRALHGVNITIRNGMFGLLGPNGAGKSTLMRLISNIFYQSRGIVYFNDYKLGDFRDSIQSYIGYLPQKFGLHGNFTAWNYLNYLALVSRWGKKEDRHKLVESVLKNVNLWDRKDDKIKTFSGGMKQRVGIAQTLLNLPKIIVVDEPTSGLDPRERIRFRNMLAEMSKNRIVIFSTHIVEDISTSCREVAVLNQGKVLFQGEPEVMRKMATGKVWESLIEEKDFTHWNTELSIVSHIKEKEGVKIRYISTEQEKELTSRQVEPTLEDAYLLMLNPV